jgi:hypothetical protein
MNLVKRPRKMPKRNSGGSKSSSGMSLVTGHSDRNGPPFPCINHCLADAAALQWGMPRPQKITFGEMSLLWRARSPDLLLRPSLQPLDRDQSRSTA